MNLAQLVFASKLVCDKKEIRYYLRNVVVFKDRVVGSNGAVAVEIKTNIDLSEVLTNSKGQLFIPPEAIKELVSRAKLDKVSFDTEVQIKLTPDNLVTLQLWNGTSVYYKLIDTSYPELKLDSLIPTEDKIEFDWQLVAKVDLAIREYLGYKKDTPTCIKFSMRSAPNGMAGMFESHDFRAVVMGLRI